MYLNFMGANNGEKDVYIIYIIYIYILPDYSFILLLKLIKGLMGNKLSLSMLHRYTWSEVEPEPVRQNKLQFFVLAVACKYSSIDFQNNIVKYYNDKQSNSYLFGELS